MSGVIDSKGVQWEHCNHCGDFVPLPELAYEHSSPAFKHGRMLCIVCVNENEAVADFDIPASWG
jgi:formylmethanofuran dehydrogenase subunit E